jgi:hypothetical protein
MPQEFDRLPYPLTPLEDLQEIYTTTSYPEENIDSGVLLDYLRELAHNWRHACQEQRKALSRPYQIGSLSLEYRAGLAQGLEDAAADLERMLAEMLDS